MSDPYNHFVFIQNRLTFSSDLLFEGASTELELDYACALYDVLLTFYFAFFPLLHPHKWSNLGRLDFAAVPYRRQIWLLWKASCVFTQV